MATKKKPQKRALSHASKKPVTKKTGTKFPEYDHKKIEKTTQKEWLVKNIYKTETTSKKKKYYVLDMFPYPSGAGLHVGHPRGYIASDVFARMKRMQGFNVLHPMGFDSFGLPAEQYAIQTGKNPNIFTEQLIKTYKKQLESIGFSYDWSREVATHRPEYYEWTQWIFLQIYNSWYDSTKNKARPIDDLVKIFEKSGNEKVYAVCNNNSVSFSAKEWKSWSEIEQQKILMNYRLAYEGYSEVNWCPELGTVLANDEIVDSPTGPVSERGGYPVEKKSMRQWFMRITAYADRLIQDLEGLDWSSHIKEIQKNWIGKSEGSEIEFTVSTGDSLKVFTTRADTLFGVTYVVLAPEHELVQKLKLQIKNWNEVETYLSEVKVKSEEDRVSSKEKTGVEIKGIKAINPVNGEEVPVWIADYVLAGYGTGAVMAVPAHDERDFAFAKKYNLLIKEVILIEGNTHPDFKGDGIDYIVSHGAYIKNGTLENSGKFSGLTSEQARKEITKFVGGKLVTKFKIRDAIFARQRYWGEPIPLIHTKGGSITTVKEKNLPLELPNVKSYTPSGTGESPLATVKAWTTAGYETNTMPGWAGSSWYFLRYMDPKNKKAFADKKALTYWKDVDMYVGGQEHATGHLLYARFWHKFLYDLGYVPTKEPFKALRNQGLIMATDGRKMSKRWGNVINPDDIVATYGADTLRVYEMFMGPFEASQPWSTESIIGSRRFVERVWRLGEKVATQATAKSSENIERSIHKAIKKVTEDIHSFGFNTAISAMMICVNDIENTLQKEGEVLAVREYLMFIQILAPFAPHMTDVLWKQFGQKGSIHTASWPTHNPKKLIDQQMTIVVQVNGKVRAELRFDTGMQKELIEAHALRDEKILPWIEGKEIKRVIYVPGKLINIVC